MNYLEEIDLKIEGCIVWIELVVIVYLWNLVRFLKIGR